MCSDLPQAIFSIETKFALRRRRDEEHIHEMGPELVLIAQGLFYRALCYRAITRLKADVPDSRVNVNALLNLKRSARL